MNLKLIKLKKKHIPFFYLWWNDPELRQFTSQNTKMLSEEEVNKDLLARFNNKDMNDFIITENEIPIGHLLIKKVKNRKYYQLYIAIGEKNYWNKGYGTMAIRKALIWFFAHFPNESILELEVNTDNLRAQRCYEKIGFVKIKEKHYKKWPNAILMRYFHK